MAGGKGRGASAFASYVSCGFFTPHLALKLALTLALAGGWEQGAFPFIITSHGSCYFSNSKRESPISENNN